MINITLPDGSVRQFDAPVTVGDVAASIGAGLAKATLAGKVDDRLVDAGFRIDRDATLSIVTDKSPEALDILRHSTAHLLAQAVQRLFPAELPAAPAQGDVSDPFAAAPEFRRRHAGLDSEFLYGVRDAELIERIVLLRVLIADAVQQVDIRLRTCARYAESIALRAWRWRYDARRKQRQVQKLPAIQRQIADRPSIYHRAERRFVVFQQRSDGGDFDYLRHIAQLHRNLDVRCLIHPHNKRLDYGALAARRFRS